MRNPFNVLIIGAGNIGAFFDTPDSHNILTHAHAFSRHRGFNLIGFYDIDIAKAKKAAISWKAQYFKSLPDAFKQNIIDIVCVAVPDSKHFQILKNITKYHPKFVFSEKPLTTSLASAKSIKNLYTKLQIPLLINYRRRFVPEFIRLKKEIDNGLYGKFVSGTGYYGKGLLHNGSHLIDLLRFYLGKVENIKITKSENDYKKNDPSVSAVLTFNKQNFYLQHINHQLYTIFEIDLLFEKARIRIIDSGITIEKYTVKNNKLLKGYRNLIKVKKYKTSLNKALYFAADHISDHLNNQAELLCSADEALEDVKLCLSISKKSVNG